MLECYGLICKQKEGRAADLTARTFLWILRIETLIPAVIHRSPDDWRTANDAITRDTGLGIHVADLETASLEEGSKVKFTVYWADAGHWEGVDFTIKVEATG